MATVPIATQTSMNSVFGPNAPFFLYWGTFIQLGGLLGQGPGLGLGPGLDNRMGKSNLHTGHLNGLELIVQYWIGLEWIGMDWDFLWLPHLCDQDVLETPVLVLGHLDVVFPSLTSGLYHLNISEEMKWEYIPQMLRSVGKWQTDSSLPSDGHPESRDQSWWWRTWALLFRGWCRKQCHASGLEKSHKK